MILAAVGRFKAVLMKDPIGTFLKALVYSITALTVMVIAFNEFGIRVHLLEQRLISLFLLVPAIGIGFVIWLLIIHWQEKMKAYTKRNLEPKNYDISTFDAEDWQVVISDLRSANTLFPRYRFRKLLNSKPVVMLSQDHFFIGDLLLDWPAYSAKIQSITLSHTPHYIALTISFIYMRRFGVRVIPFNLNDSELAMRYARSIADLSDTPIEMDFEF